MVLAAACWLGAPGFGYAAQGAASPQNPRPDANDLVRRVMAREVERVRPDSSRWMYRLRKQSQSGAQTRELLETDFGLVARTVEINDRPLTADERRRDDQRLARLLSNPGEQRRRQREQEEDRERVMKLLRALPDAFFYEYEGREMDTYGPALRLKFYPNPRFVPPSRETQIYRSMKGTLWIDESAQRLLRLDASLFKDLKIGWGIIGHLDRGGRLKLEQSRIADQRWEVTSMRLDLTGRALLFKPIRIQQEQSLSRFQRVPGNLTLAEGIALLRRRDQPQSHATAP